MTTNTFGKTLKTVRQELGMTQRDLAEKLNVSTSLIGQYEAGIRLPRKNNFEKIYNALNNDIRLVFATAYSVDCSHIVPAKDSHTGFYISLTKDQHALLSIVNSYNALGMAEIIKRAEELTHIDKYVKK